jgi:transcriptional regulator with GAF, ATPase, and Fis domain
VLTLAPDFSRVTATPASAAPPASSEISLAPAAHTATSPAASGAMEHVERRHIESVLNQTNWMIEGERGAARVLNLNASTLRSRMQKLGIHRPKP